MTQGRIFIHFCRPDRYSNSEAESGSNACNVARGLCISGAGQVPGHRGTNSHHENIPSKFLRRVLRVKLIFNAPCIGMAKRVQERSAKARNTNASILQGKTTISSVTGNVIFLGDRMLRETLEQPGRPFG